MRGSPCLPGVMAGAMTVMSLIAAASGVLARDMPARDAPVRDAAARDDAARDVLAQDAPAQDAAQAPTFKTRAEGVWVDVLVTDGGGRPVAGLTAKDFELRDRGVPQEVTVSSIAALPLDVILVLDTSTSLGEQGLRDLIGAARVMLDVLRPADRVALVTFSQRVRIRSMLTPRIPQVRARLDDLTLDGSTSVIDGTHAGLVLQTQQDERPTLLLVFSDGIDTDSWLEARAVIEVVRRSAAVPHAVVVGSGVAANVRQRQAGPVGRHLPPPAADLDDADRFLQDLVAAGGGVILDAGTTKQLDRRFTEVLDAFRQRYVLTYTPDGRERQGWHPLSVRVNGRTVRARPGYYVP